MKSNLPLAALGVTHSRWPEAVRNTRLVPAEIQPLDPPAPARGMQGFWEWATLDLPRKDAVANG